MESMDRLCVTNYSIFPARNFRIRAGRTIPRQTEEYRTGGMIIYGAGTQNIENGPDFSCIRHALIVIIAGTFGRIAVIRSMYVLVNK